MEACIACNGLTFTYPGRGTPALRGIDLAVQPGEFVVLCGPSGCGKTTLLRQMKPSLAPHGTHGGELFFEGKPLSALSKRDAAANIGFVMQNPDHQMVTDKVWHELAFGLESLGYDTETIRLRTAEMASFFGMQAWFYEDVKALSGGQKQLLALASVMALQPSLLILDEPTSQLDPIAAAEFLGNLGKINRELGVTIILTEHRLEEALPLASRAVVMEQGRVVCQGSPAEVGIALRGQGMFAAMPVPMRVWASVDSSPPCPITVREGRAWLSGMEIKNEMVASEDLPHSGKPAIELRNAWFKYEKNGPDVLKGLSFKSYPSELTCILGGNGTGKTTALSVLAGLHRPYRGQVSVSGSIAMLPQNPQLLFAAKTLREDLRELLSERKLSKQEKQMRLDEITTLCRLEGLLECHPYDLSGGEQQRAALAKVLLLEPQILLLDEPTKGLDAEYKAVFAEILRGLCHAGKTLVMVSHDLEFCAEYADRCALFFDGNIVTENPPRAFFSGNSFYTSAANRMARHVLPGAVTANDIIAALGGAPTLPPDLPASLPAHDDSDGEDDHEQSEAAEAPLTEQEESPSEVSRHTAKKQKLPRRTFAAAVMILLAIPLTIAAGNLLFDGRKHLMVSLLIIIETMLPFLFLFERRKPQARELVIIAVLSAIAVAGRAVFFMLPQFKPVTALVIVAGIAFGGEAGFFVGAVTGFVSNLFFSQGPWTPWQMFAFGLIGFLAGVLFKKGWLPRHRLPLCIYGGLATFVIYGGLLNASSMLTYQSNPSLSMYITYCAQGLPMDLVHALATVIFLAIAALPMLDKLDRIKVKYGLIE